MTDEIGKAYIELPGDPASGNWMEKNLVILHAHRDVVVKIDLSSGVLFRLFSPARPFYSPKIKKQCTEYSFASGEEVHIWLAKTHQTPVEIQKWRDNDWETYSVIDPAQWDGADYSHAVAQPAPIIFKAGPQGMPIGTSVKIPKPGMTIAQDYQLQLAKCHHSTYGTASKAALKAKWEENKFPRLGELALLPCHEPEGGCFVEIDPSTDLFKQLTDKVGDLPSKELVIEGADWFRQRMDQARTELEPLANRLQDSEKELKGALGFALDEEYRKVADALMAVLGQVVDKGALARDLAKTQVRFVVKEFEGGVVKKFVILSGYAATRHFLTGTRYGVANAKVATITASKMSIQELAETSARKVGEAAKSKAFWAFAVVGLLMDTVQYRSQPENQRELENLLAKYTITVGGAFFMAALEPFIAAVVGGLLGLASVPALIVTAGVVAAVIAIGFFVIAPGLEAIGAEQGVTNFIKKLEEAWHESFAVFDNDGSDIVLIGP